MRTLIALATLAVALCASSAAVAGGWATVGIAPLPDDVAPGGTWSPRITILQHGRTPLDGLTPVVTITEDDGGFEQVTAAPAGEPGVYEASVVFPEAGQWRVVVDSGFGESRLTYGPVLIEGGSPGGDGWFLPVPALAAVGLAVALLAAGVLGHRRFRRLTPASR